MTEGRLYAGIEAVRLGLADELGGDSEAMDKAAELAGISNYGTVDVNAEVLREIIQRTRRIFRAEHEPTVPGLNDTLPSLVFDNIDREDPLPDFPLEINRPNIYYLYAGHDY